MSPYKDPGTGLNVSYIRRMGGDAPYRQEETFAYPILLGREGMDESIKDFMEEGWRLEGEIKTERRIIFNREEEAWIYKMVKDWPDLREGRDPTD